MRLKPSTAFDFSFFVQQSLIHSATTNPHTGKTGLVEADFDVFAAKPGAAAFATVAAADYDISEIGRGWYNCAVTTTTDFIDSTEGQGILSIAYGPAVLPDGYNAETIWEERYNVGYDPSDTCEWLGQEPAEISATGGYIQAILQRWLTDDGAGTPDALDGGLVPAKVMEMQANVMTAAAAAADLTTELQSGLATAANLALVQSDVDDVQSRLPAALDGGRMNSVTNAMGANVLTAAATAADFGTEVATAVWNFVTEGTHTAVQVFRGMASVIMGKLAISGNTRTYRDLDDTKDRVEAEVTSAGRTSVDYVDLG